MNNTYSYKTYEDDFITTEDANYKLPNNYVWIHENILYKICSNILYYITYIIGFFYCKIFLHVKIENKKVLKRYKKQGFFIYGNHTLAIGDVFIPAIATFPKRTYVVANSTNLKVKLIGPLLPMIGILPIPDSKMKIKKLTQAIEKRIEQNKAVVIYPEAHVWPYYTKIRPYKETAFRYPVQTNSHSFCITTTYYKRKNRKKPGIKVYIDGPFNLKEELTNKENQINLKDEILKKMEERSKKSTYEYIKYVKIEDGIKI